MIVVIATIQCRPGTREQFLAEFHRIVPEVLRENGCIEYGPTVDAETPLSNQSRDTDRVTIVEKWESVAALEAHLQAPHMTEYRPKVKDFVVSSELRVLTPT
ncbi:MAG: antibiotic biosynthesis monooxygenase [Planctomycetaceae bacterium]|nr:antibiotic biosynthesis monooxygenase [Planctomycetaceae bacterium]